MKKRDLLKMFKEANPKLVELSPKIVVDEITEEVKGSKGNSEHCVYNPPLLRISVKHPFIFDNRLVPEEFNGIKVLNIIIGDFPLEFPEPTHDLEPLEQHFAPERYVSFVSRSLNLIRKKLKNPDLSKIEALDAITGGFENHVKWCKELAENSKNHEN